MAFAKTSLLKTPTMLEQLLEEINFQRTKEMRQLLKDDSGFVMLQGTTYWTDLFVRHFLFQNEHAIDCDDLLFFVRKKHVKSSSRYLPKFETEVDVFRKDSRKLPIGDPDIDWEETVYLNLIIHQFDYTLTLAICTRTSPKELQVLRRHSQKVYASPSRRRMDTKGEVEEMTYPHICFMVDNFDEVFCDILVRDGEMVCVELVASDREGAIQGVIFLGSIRYDALKKVYDARQSSLSTKMAQRMTFGLFSSGAAQRCEFVRMKGPQGKGHAEMAVTKPKGSGVETPTSEPGYCMTDMWDSDWEEDPDEFYAYRHQRRLSDPSANLNNFVRSGFKNKGCDGIGTRARSENEGLDCMENGVSEIEAGDVRDDMDFCLHSSHPASSSQSRGCCDCWRARRDSLSIMSEVYCRSAEAQADRLSASFTFKNLLNRVDDDFEIADDAASVKVEDTNVNNSTHDNPLSFNREEFEFADDAISLNEESLSNDETQRPPSRNSSSSVKSNKSKEVKFGHISDLDPKTIITVNGKEELPSPEQFRAKPVVVNNIMYDKVKKSNKTETNNKESLKECHKDVEIKISDTFNGNDDNSNKIESLKILSRVRSYCTLPKRKRDTTNHKIWYRPVVMPPHRITPDGTDIYYWCDMPKKTSNELDDGQYNPLWTMRGFTQTFHFWKENKRAQSVPLNAFLTYITLPWWSIAKDILDHREGPILTF